VAGSDGDAQERKNDAAVIHSTIEQAVGDRFRPCMHASLLKAAALPIQCVVSSATKKKIICSTTVLLF
jgi:methylphosphotriester-DNA--protein-cysteine methyltransferase